MKQSKSMSRRDWFRLRTRPENRMLSQNTEAATGADAGAEDLLSPIEHPPNHDGLDLSQLPPMREAILSKDQVDALFSDIENFATDVLLMQRSAHSARASAPKLDTAKQLELTKSALVAGQQQRVQIRYRWQDALWIDTLENQASGFRLVRIEHRERFATTD